ncbi:MAG TPA: T9SS type A sorting domain-containing protein [Ignavibacteria bacterium]|nr:T9SS type A sorting domain-containing protein [Ignavibacteria bacterium]
MKKISNHIKFLVLAVLLFPLSSGTIFAQGIYDWSSIKNGTNGVVNAITVYDNKVVIGGNFSEAGGVPAANIAQWDGTNWQAIGSGFPEEVYALAVYKNELIAAGSYIQTGADTARIFRFSGGQWLPLGKGFVARANEHIRSLLVDDDKLYAAGLFKLNQTAGGASNIAVYDEQQEIWENLGDGLDLEVFCLVSHNNDLIAGGEFTSSDTAQVNHVARWNGNKWQRIGEGLGGTVRALTIFNGDIIAGGEFSGHISRWSGSWQVLGNGVSDTVKSLSTFKNNLIVGGSFRYAGSGSDSLFVNGIVQWNGAVWQGLTSGMNKDVRALISDKGKLYAGGGFFSAGGDSVNYVAYWDTVPTVQINGVVKYINGTPVNNGVAKAVRYDIYTRGIITYDTSVVQNDGTYQLSVPVNKPARIIIIADDELDYIPTYYPATIYWENAIVVEQNTDGDGYDVTVEDIDNSINSGSISGRVQLDYTPQGYPSGNNLDIRSGAIVYARVGASWKAFGISNRFENYQLNNLPKGSYQIIVNRLGYSTEVLNNVNLAPGQQMQDVNFTLAPSDGGEVNISGNTSVIPESYMLHQNYPNPFNPVSSIKFEIPLRSNVTLKVYNVTGQVVAELLNEQVLSAGIYTAQFDGGNLASGIYFYSLGISGENGTSIFSGTKKMILLK